MKTKIIILAIIAWILFFFSIPATYYIYGLNYEIFEAILTFVICNLFTAMAIAEMLKVKQEMKEDDWYQQWLDEQFSGVRMSHERYTAIMQGREQLTQLDIDNGYHFCPDWDGLLIHRNDEEYKHCNCEK